MPTAYEPCKVKYISAEGLTMGKIEQELLDLEEYLIRNDDKADNSVYLTIVNIANNTSELETKIRQLWELCEDMYEWMERAMYDGSTRKHDYELIVSCMQDLGFDVK